VQLCAGVTADNTGAVLWATGTTQVPNAQLVLQKGDGNLVLYDSGGRAMWNAHTAGQGAVEALLQDDCNFVVYGAGRQPLWATYSRCTAPPPPPPPAPPGPGPGPGPPLPPGPGVQLCAGVTADNTGAVDASRQFQQCVDGVTAGGTLAVPPGTYSIGQTIKLNHALTLTTASAAGAAACLAPAAPPCATLRASAALSGELVSMAGSGVIIDHLVVDGNRAARLQSMAASRCSSGQNHAGCNVYGLSCVSCSFIDSASTNALCGTGLGWVGRDCTIRNNLIFGNGDHFTRNMWSDGVTLLDGDGCVVTGNTFVDNSDINLILGSGSKATVKGNVVQMKAGKCFGGIMLDNFNGGTKGNYSQLNLEGNTVDCGAQKCDYGMQMGPGSWYVPAAQPVGGRVVSNTVSGANILYNFNRMGSPEQPLVFYGNIYGTHRPGNYTAWCGKSFKGGALNIFSSYVDRNGETSPEAMTQDNTECP